MINNNRPTPETDARTYIPVLGASTVPAEFARKLECERNDALAELEEYRSIAENIGAKKAVSEKEKAIRERDELQKAINGLCEHLGVSPANTTLLAVEVLRIERERDEAMRLLELCAEYSLTTYQEQTKEFLKKIK